MACQWFSPGTLVSSTNKTDCLDIAEILLNVAVNTIILSLTHFRKHLTTKWNIFTCVDIDKTKQRKLN
jgi:hypothetical protein